MIDCITYSSITSHIVNAQRPIEHKTKQEDNFKNRVKFVTEADNGKTTN